MKLASQQRWWPVHDPTRRQWWVVDLRAPLDDARRGELGPFFTEQEADQRAVVKNVGAISEDQTP